MLDLQFYVRGDDNAVVLLSDNASPANLKVAAISPSASRDWYGDRPALRISRRIRLDAGMPRYFRALHLEWDGADFFEAALRVHADSNPDGVAAALGSEAQRAHRSAMTVHKLALSATAGTFKLRIKFTAGFQNATGATGDWVESSAIDFTLLNPDKLRDAIREVCDAAGVEMTSLYDAYMTRDRDW